MRIVIGHLPLYAVSVGRNSAGEVLNNADQLRSLLERYRVHTYISGHHHAYFPGHRGQVQLLHSGAIGSGPRQLLNSSLPPRKTVTIVDINLNSASTTYTTYDLSTLTLIDQQQLPRIITGVNGFVLRQDMTCSTLPPAERSTCSD
jgi:Calcineurin-like phosphoesterase